MGFLDAHRSLLFPTHFLAHHTTPLRGTWTMPAVIRNKQQIGNPKSSHFLLPNESFTCWMHCGGCLLSSNCFLLTMQVHSVCVRVCVLICEFLVYKCDLLWLLSRHESLAMFGCSQESLMAEWQGTKGLWSVLRNNSIFYCCYCYYCYCCHNYCFCHSLIHRWKSVTIRCLVRQSVRQSKFWRSFSRCSTIQPIIVGSLSIICCCFCFNSSILKAASDKIPNEMTVSFFSVKNLFYKKRRAIRNAIEILHLELESENEIFGISLCLLCLEELEHKITKKKKKCVGRYNFNYLCIAFSILHTYVNL